MKRLCHKIASAKTIMSNNGILENEKVVVLEGPLKGREGLIRKIDRHKRLAWLEIEMFGRKTKFEVGLEIVRKE